MWQLGMHLKWNVEPEVLSGLRVPLPRPISKEHVSVAPEEPGRRGAGSQADEADLVPSGESPALGVNHHRRSLYDWEAKRGKGLSMTRGGLVSAA